MSNPRAPFTPQSAYTYDELIACAKGKLFGPGNARLPLPPMLMFDEITTINDTGGDFGKGYIEARLNIRPDLWFFDCHFHEDPVMPGCLGLDAMWQLIGFFLGWTGGEGVGRALGSGDIRFTGQVMPDVKRVQYHVHIKRLIRRKLVMGIADASLVADGTTIYTAEDLRVGLFHKDT